MARQQRGEAFSADVLKRQSSGGLSVRAFGQAEQLAKSNSPAPIRPW